MMPNTRFLATGPSRTRVRRESGARIGADRESRCCDWRLIDFGASRARESPSHDEVRVPTTRHREIRVSSGWHPPHRSVESVAAWLQAYPSIEVEACDCSGLYADGIARGRHRRSILPRGYPPTVGTCCTRRRGMSSSASFLRVWIAHVEPTLDSRQNYPHTFWHHGIPSVVSFADRCLQLLMQELPK